MRVARRYLFLVIGFVSGVVFVVACPRPSGTGSGGSWTSSTGTGMSSETLGPETASAATGGEAFPCDSWEVRFKRMAHYFEDDETLAITAGWEPFQVEGYDADNVTIISRRCAS